MGEYDADLRIFPDEFVPNVQASKTYQRWAKSSPGDRGRWEAFRDALLAGQEPSVPSMSTTFGRALVAAGKEHMSISQLVGTVTNPYPPPQPPPTDPSLTYIDALADLKAVFRPDWTEPAQEGASRGSGGVYEISTPHGGGFQFICTADMTNPWNPPTSKLCYANWSYTEQGPGSPLNQTDHWELYAYFPTQALINDWNVNVLWEFHTDLSSGHHLALYSNGTYRIVRQSGPGQTYAFTQGPSISWDAWTKIEYDVKWSYGSDGFLTIKFDGQTYLNWTGPTLFDAGLPYLQFGWYGLAAGSPTNEVRLGGVGYRRA